MKSACIDKKEVWYAYIPIRWECHFRCDATRCCHIFRTHRLRWKWELEFHRQSEHIHQGIEHWTGNHGWAPMKQWIDRTQTLQHQRMFYSKSHLLDLDMARTAQKCTLCIILFETCASPDRKWRPMISQVRLGDRIQCGSSSWPSWRD